MDFFFQYGTPILKLTHYVFCAWKEDLNRSKDGSFRSNFILPDHIKAAAHLTYWIRRESPIIDLRTKSGTMYSDPEIFTIEMDIDLCNLEDCTEISIHDEQNTTMVNSKMTLAQFKENREFTYPDS